jgi:glycosyltransferase involved in cell wall biosynthesis
MFADRESIDVVIPVFNAERFIERTLGSVVAQTRPVGKIVIVNDGSTDRSLSVIESFVSRAAKPEIFELHSTPNRGHASAVNYGISRTKADFVALLDADDVWHADKIERQIEVFRKNPRAGLVYCDYDVIDVEDRKLDQEIRLRVVPQLRGRVAGELIRKGNRISGSNSAVLIRGDLLRTNLFDESLLACEDWDLWIRLSSIVDFDFSPEPLVSIRRHVSSQSSDPGLMLNFNLLVVKKHMKDASFLQRKWAIARILNQVGLKYLVLKTPAVWRVLRKFEFSLLDFSAFLILAIPFGIFRRILMLPFQRLIGSKVF